MKSPLIAGAMAAALTAATFGQVNSSLIEIYRSPWQVIEVLDGFSLQDDC